MMVSRKALMSVVEMGLLFLLLLGVITYISSGGYQEHKTKYMELNSYLDTVVKNETYRSVIMQENLSTTSPSAQALVLNASLNSSFGEYSLMIANETTKKWLWRCEPTYQRIYVERFIAIENLTHYEPRWVRLGVCT